MYNMSIMDKVYKYFHDTYELQRQDVDELLERHENYGTILLTDKYFVRFNVNDDTAHVIDCVCDAGVKGIRTMCKEGKKRFPYLKKIRFERGLKSRNEWREYDIDKFIKEGE